MALKDELLSKMAEIEDMERSLKAEKEMYEQLTKELYEKQAEVEQKKVDAEKAIAKAGGIEEVKRLHDDYLAKISKLDAEIIAQKRKNRELAAWENKLVEIEKRQDQDHADLIAQRKLLEEEKATYKETIKKEFLDALKERMQ